MMGIPRIAIADLQTDGGLISAPYALIPHRGPRTITDGFQGKEAGHG
jgi:hypothetical protein